MKLVLQPRPRLDWQMAHPLNSRSPNMSQEGWPFGCPSKVLRIILELAQIAAHSCRPRRPDDCYEKSGYANSFCVMAD